MQRDHGLSRPGGAEDDERPGGLRHYDVALVGREPPAEPFERGRAPVVEFLRQTAVDVFVP